MCSSDRRAKKGFRRDTADGRFQEDKEVPYGCIFASDYTTMIAKGQGGNIVSAVG